MPPRENSFGNIFFHINEDWDTLSEYPNIAAITSLSDWLTLYHTTPIYRGMISYEPSIQIGAYVVIGFKPTSVFSQSMLCYLNTVVSITRIYNASSFKFKSVTNPTDNWIGMFNFDDKCIDKNKSYFLQQLLS